MIPLGIVTGVLQGVAGSVAEGVAGCVAGGVTDGFAGCVAGGVARFVALFPTKRGTEE